MKHRLSLLITLFWAASLCAQVQIHVDNPATWNAKELKPFVGQTVVFDVPIVVCNNAGYSLTVSTRRLFSPTNQARPLSDEYKTIMNLNAEGAMNLSGAPSRTNDNPYRCGEKIYNLKVKVNSPTDLQWISGDFRGNKRADLENADIRAMVNADGCDECLLVCTMNLEYYLAVDFDPHSSMGPDNLAEHQKQRTKIKKALSKINADLFGFVEIQQGQDALIEICNDLNTLLPGRHFLYIDDKSKPSGTYTKSGFIYDSNKLRRIGELQEIDTRVPNRKKMICFEEIKTKERFIFSVNHFKAKSGSGATGKDADQGDGQGQFNASRCEEAQAVVDQYKRYRPQLKEKDILLMGDLNALGMEDPIRLMVNDNGMIDLHRAFHADSSYSYRQLDATLAGYLDHAICNGTLFPQVTGVAAFHINSDELDKYTYDKSNDNTMFRCSDHDPVIVGLKLDSTLVYDPSPAMNSYEVFTGDARKLIINNAYKDSKRSFYAIYDISGVLIEQEEIKGYLHEVEIPQKSGMYIVYVYSDGQVYQRKMIVR